MTAQRSWVGNAKTGVLYSTIPGPVDRPGRRSERLKRAAQRSTIILQRVFLASIRRAIRGLPVDPPTIWVVDNTAGTDLDTHVLDRPVHIEQCHDSWLGRTWAEAMSAVQQLDLCASHICGPVCSGCSATEAPPPAKQSKQSKPLAEIPE